LDCACGHYSDHVAADRPDQRRYLFEVIKREFGVQRLDDSFSSCVNAIVRPMVRKRRQAAALQKQAKSMCTVTYHHDIFPESDQYTWEQDSISFDELIVSWNAMRPQCGRFQISVSVKINGIWSPLYPYASWGNGGQQGGNVHDTSIRIKEDILELLNGRQATGFRIVLKAEEGAHLDEFYSLHACASVITTVFSEKMIAFDHSFDLSVPLISQMQLHHPRHRDMCSASATAAAVSYLMKIDRLDPVSFALQAHDDAFGILGNWVLNTAQASSILGKHWSCWVERLSGFHDIYNHLKRNIPVVVSVKGPLSGSALPYNQGHLIVVKGYSHQEKHVLCMDPAFAEDKLTEVRYCLNDFLEAWSRRGCIAYIFKAKS
jgi:Peptidase_C39 like family